MKHVWMARGVVLAGLPLHLALAVGTDLSPDEAYYLCAARAADPALALVDHGPLIAWMLRATDALSPSLGVGLAARLWPLLLSVLLGLTTVELARQRGASGRGLGLTALVATFSLMGTAYGFTTTPDGPFLLSVAILLWLDGSRATQPGPGRDLTWGVVAGLGLLAKVTMLPIAAALLLTQPQVRRGWLLRLGPLVAMTPWILPSLEFQLHHAFADRAGAEWSAGGAVGALLEAIGVQLLLWTPWVLLTGLLRLWRAEQMHRPERWMVFTLCGLITISSLVRATPPEANWWAPAALALLAWAALPVADLPTRHRAAMVASVVLPTAVAAAHTLVPFLPLPSHLDPTARLHGWSEGREPLQAAGLGPYGPLAERCIYHSECTEIVRYLNRQRPPTPLNTVPVESDSKSIE